MPSQKKPTPAVLNDAEIRRDLEAAAAALEAVVEPLAVLFQHVRELGERWMPATPRDRQQLMDEEQLPLTFIYRAAMAAVGCGEGALEDIENEISQLRSAAATTDGKLYEQFAAAQWQRFVKVYPQADRTAEEVARG